MACAAVPDEAAVWEALRGVVDPEVGENAVDLGLVYAVECGPGRVRVELTMTSPACPSSGAMADDAERVIRRACAAADVRVEIVHEPPWTPERMSDAAKQRFGW